MIYLQNNCYNLDIAKIFGVHTSAFLSCLDMEYDYQFRNKMLNSNSTMSLSRAEIYAKTAIDDETQKEVEVILQECGVLTMKPLQNVPNKNYYIIDYDHLKKILESQNPAEEIASSKAKQFIKPKRVEPMSKRQTHIVELKKKVNMEDPVIQQYFVDWIDSVYTRQKGFLSPSGVTIAQQELLAYSLVQEVQINILKIAIKGGLRDMTWAIEQYEKQFGKDARNFAKYDDIKEEEPADSDSETF